MLRCGEVCRQLGAQINRAQRTIGSGERHLRFENRGDLPQVDLVMLADGQCGHPAHHSRDRSMFIVPDAHPVGVCRGSVCPQSGRHSVCTSDAGSRSSFPALPELVAGVEGNADDDPAQHPQDDPHGEVTQGDPERDADTEAECDADTDPRAFRVPLPVVTFLIAHVIDPTAGMYLLIPLSAPISPSQLLRLSRNIDILKPIRGLLRVWVTPNLG